MQTQTQSAILVDSGFEVSWSFAADHFHALWKKQGPVDFHRAELGYRTEQGAPYVKFQVSAAF